MSPLFHRFVSLVFITGLLVSPWLLTGMVTKKYVAVGSFADSVELFTGTIHYHIFSGHSKIMVASSVSNIQCNGNAYVADNPIKSASKIGLGGVFELFCSDGRKMTGEWAAESLSLGSGSGLDDEGNLFYFTFAKNLQDAQLELAKRKTESK